jgi:hypothetical protein
VRWLVLIPFFLTAAAYAADPADAEKAKLYDVGAMAGVGFNSSSISITSGDPSTISRGAIVAGASVTRWMSPFWAIEVDGVYALRKYNLYNFNQGPFENHYSIFEVPVFGRVKAYDGVTFGLGPYFGEVLGTLPPYTNRGFEFGIAGSIRLATSPIESLGGICAFVDVRYLLGLTNQSDEGTYRERQTEAFAGVSMSF